MPLVDEHCKDCRDALGEDFREIHEWLDEFFPSRGLRHRVVRHQEVRKKWGDRAAKAAQIHIEKDCYGKVPTREEAELWDILT